MNLLDFTHLPRSGAEVLLEPERGGAQCPRACLGFTATQGPGSFPADKTSKISGSAAPSSGYLQYVWRESLRTKVARCQTCGPWVDFRSMSQFLPLLSPSV